MIIIPEAANIPAASLSGIKKFIQAGGKVVIMGDESLSKDERNRELSKEDREYIFDNAVIVQTTLTDDKLRIASPTNLELQKKLLEMFNEWGLTEVVLIDKATNQPVNAVEWRSTQYQDKMLVNICNYEWGKTKYVDVLINGKKMGSLQDLISNKNMGSAKLELHPFDPVLLSFDNSEKSFDDIQEHWAKNDIEALAAWGIVKGVNSKLFAPEYKITRAQFLDYIVKALNLDTVKYKNSFKDVNSKEWYANTIETAYAAGMIDEAMISGMNFKPQSLITREEMISLIVLAYHHATGEKAETADVQNFADQEQIANWASDYVKEAYALGMIQGSGSNDYFPKENVTRAEAAVMIKRLLEKL